MCVWVCVVDYIILKVKLHGFAFLNTSKTSFQKYKKKTTLHKHKTSTLCAYVDHNIVSEMELIYLSGILLLLLLNFLQIYSYQKINNIYQNICLNCMM